MNYSEKQFFIKSNRSLYAILYEPKTTGLKEKAILIVHPFAEEKKSSQHILVATAKSLAAEGYFVLCFDLSGCGDSVEEDSLTSLTIYTWLEDISSARKNLMEASGATQVILLNIRFSSFLCLYYNSKYKQDNQIVMIAPVLDPIKYLHKVMRSKLIKELLTAGSIQSNRDLLIANLENDISVDFDGYLITSLFYKSLTDAHNEFSIHELFSNTNKKYIILVTGYKSLTKEQCIFIENNKIPTEVISIPTFWDKVEMYDCASLLNPIKRMIANG